MRLGPAPHRTRRAVLIAALLGTAALGACAPDKARPATTAPARRALVYRDPAGCTGCSETLAERLGAPPLSLETAFIGPDGELPLAASSLAGALLYAQPGGGDDVTAAADALPEEFRAAVRAFVEDGGKHLGMCMGAYLAGADAFSLVEHAIEGEVGVTDFPVQDSADAVVEVEWGGEVRWTYFQEGARLPEHGAEPFARYATGDLAAARYRVGSGEAALVGPHPEADESWLAEAGLTDPDGDDWGYAAPLVQRLLG